MARPFSFAPFKNNWRGALLVIVLFGPHCLFGAERQPGSYLGWEREAQEAFASGKHQEAVAMTDQAVARYPNPRNYLIRGRLLEATRAFTNAIADYDRVLRSQTNSAEAYLARGGARFRLGQVEDALADFDKFNELQPKMATYNWQRGIALYYVKRFDDGRKQFELHQTLNANDVENAVWHFLCVTRTSGIEKARAALLPIPGDPRVPMMQIHALFADKLKPGDVMKAAEAGDPEKRPTQLFYAHLYLGLYYEARNEDKPAREHITKAAELFDAGGYMGDVARVHLQRRWPKAADAPAAKPN